MTPDQCANGLMCIDGQCRSFCCDGSNEDCSIGTSCLPYSGSNVGTCRASATCDLVAQTGCDPGEACFPGPGDTLICLSPGTAAVDAACTATNECVSGSFCFIPVGMTTGFCRAFCRMSDAMPCAQTGFMCQGVNGFPTGVGMCVPMMNP